MLPREGLASAFVIALPVAALYVNLQSAGVYVPRLDPPDVIMAPAALAGLTVTLAWRRYR